MTKPTVVIVAEGRVICLPCDSPNVFALNAATGERLWQRDRERQRDLTGISVYDQAHGEFRFVAGTVFANVVLVDEINRTTPRTQSALLEPMEERQVTVEGVTHRLPEPYLVIATENPVEQHGTYPLPEGQLDRFALRVEIGYPDAAGSTDLVRRQLEHHPLRDLEPVLSPEEVRAALSQAHLPDASSRPRLPCPPSCQRDRQE